MFFLFSLSSLIFHESFSFALCLQVPFARSSLTHSDVFVLDTKTKIFQFNGANTTKQERTKALDVAQYIKDSSYPNGCDMAVVGE